MTAPRGRTLPVLLAAAVLVGGANLAAYAADGRPLLLGSTNRETRPAVVQNSGSGPALSLRSRPGAPSLAVSSEKKVARLNADRVDGLEGAALRTTARTYTVPAYSGTSTFHVSFPGLAPGRYLASYSVFSYVGSGDVRAHCYMEPLTSAPWHLFAASGLYGNSVISMSASGLLDTRTHDYMLTCNATADFSLPAPADGAVVSQVTFLRLDAVTTGVPGS